MARGMAQGLLGGWNVLQRRSQLQQEQARRDKLAEMESSRFNLLQDKADSELRQRHADAIIYEHPAEARGLMTPGADVGTIPFAKELAQALQVASPSALKYVQDYRTDEQKSQLAMDALTKKNELLLGLEKEKADLTEKYKINTENRKAAVERATAVALGKLLGVPVPDGITSNDLLSVYKTNKAGSKSGEITPAVILGKYHAVQSKIASITSGQDMFLDDPNREKALQGLHNELKTYEKQMRANGLEEWIVADRTKAPPQYTDDAVEHTAKLKGLTKEEVIKLLWEKEDNAK